MPQILKTQEIVKTLFDLSRQEKPGVVIISGPTGAGKSTLRNALQQTQALGTVGISLDFWIYASSQTRRKRLMCARMQGDKHEIDFCENPLNAYNWKNFYSDFRTLLQTRTLQLRGAYEKATGEMTLNLDLKIPDQRPHLIVLEGGLLLHPPLPKQADSVIYLDAERSVLERRVRARDKDRKMEDHLEDDLERNARFDASYFGRWASSADYHLNRNEADALLQSLKSFTRQENSAAENKCTR